MATTARKTAKNAPRDPSVELPSYEVLAPLEHDGTAYSAGDLVQLDDAASAALLAVNVVRPAEQTA